MRALRVTLRAARSLFLSALAITARMRSLQPAISWRAISLAAFFLLLKPLAFLPILTYQLKLLKSALKHSGAKENEWFPASPFAAKPYSTIIDGIFGAGINRAPTGRPKEAIDFINIFRANEQTCSVVSVDIPSGLALEAHAPTHPCVRADTTITFGCLKRAHISEPTKSFCGKSYATNIGLFAQSPITNWYHQRRRALLSLYHPIAPQSYKGQFGHVLVYEGNPQFLGASRLSARAALRVGAGLVTIACDHSDMPSPLDLPEFMRKKRAEITEDFLEHIDAIVLGPGLSNIPVYQNHALDFITRWHANISCLVLDADGLRLLDKNLPIEKLTIVATPHPGEAANLLGSTTADIERDRFKAIADLGAQSESRNQQIIWVLKGATTLVRALNKEIFAFHGDLPILAAGGSGDTLSGAIAGSVKQTASPLAAALLAVSMQIEAAQVLSRRIRKGSLATELADLFPTIARNRPISK